MNINKGQERINKVRVMNNGQKAIIKDYRKATDIDVQFEDGTIVLHKPYCNFKAGLIKNSNIPQNKQFYLHVKMICIINICL